MKTKPNKKISEFYRQLGKKSAKARHKKLLARAEGKTFKATASSFKRSPIPQGEAENNTDKLYPKK